MNPRNIALLCDYYEYIMVNGYIEKEMGDHIVYFDIFFRRVPDNGGFVIVTGLEQIINYINELHFDDSDIEFFRSKNIFKNEFLDYLKTFQFTGDIYAVPEGTPMFPGEPMMIIRAPIIEAQILETFFLLTLGYQTLITTKASRIVRAAAGKTVLELGSRRAQGTDAAILGARAAYIAGCEGTSCTVSDKWFSIPSTGTMSHSWVQIFDLEYEAFKTFCELYPNNPTLLVDTYDTLNSGVPNAIKAFKDTIKKTGEGQFAIRLDSGDLAFLSKKARKMLDDENLRNCKIIASGSLDEWLIKDLIDQGACIDVFGVGDNLITSHSEPIFDGVYKIVAIEDKNGNIVPKIKISENIEKITTPHFKKVYRLYDENGKAIADQICVYDETIDASKPLKIFDPSATRKSKVIKNFTAKEILVPIFKNGKLVYELPTMDEVRCYCKNQINTLWDEVKRLSNPYRYRVDLSEKLWNIKNELLHKSRTS